jgi:hypothetical protein
MKLIYSSYLIEEWMHLKPHDLEDTPNENVVEAQAAGKEPRMKKHRANLGD